MALKRNSEISGGSYFKCAAHTDYAMLVFEPLSVERDVPNTYKGKANVRDEVTCDVTTFASKADIKAGKGTTTRGMIVHNRALTNRLSRAIGDAVPGTLGKEMFEGSAGESWVIVDPSDEEFEQVAAWYEGVSQARAEAEASAPDFD